MAVIHIAALLDPEVKDERIQAWCTPFNWNDFLALWREKYPDKKFIDDLPNMGKISAKIDDTLPRELLKKWGGQDGWITMTNGLQETVDCILADADN